MYVDALGARRSRRPGAIRTSTALLGAASTLSGPAVVRRGARPQDQPVPTRATRERHEKHEQEAWPSKSASGRPDLRNVREASALRAGQGVVARPEEQAAPRGACRACTGDRRTPAQPEQKGTADSDSLRAGRRRRSRGQVAGARLWVTGGRQAV
ncbi:hypothetical protein DMC30DRAFT_209620 [Rhodotorula diobovata]|uniref:Uncharacterized protein n=1 Tax=Rhodotorula diobovata TaxID=5288 RepID=A0A5C5FWH3_9BASI|nr:hypothetical protein DMC30DRAFT_209620 [Rhodotorula diobovata]